MTNDELREKIREIILDEEILNEIILLEGDEFADGAVGISDNYHIIYDYDQLVHSLMSHDDLSFDDAVDMLEYNTLRALPYMQSQGRAPIIMNSFEIKF